MTWQEALWRVRYGGRESGPFTLERLRLMARRGALTRMHQLSQDGRHWLAAADVRAVFNADGSVVEPRAHEPPSPDIAWNGIDVQEVLGAVGEAMRVPTPPRMTDFTPTGATPKKTATILMAQVAALLLIVAALAAPTQRTADGALAWWFNGPALSLVVHGACALGVPVWMMALTLRRAPALGGVLAAASVALAVAVVVPLHAWAPWVVPAGAALPVAGVLMAYESRCAEQAHAVGATMVMIGGMALLGTGVLVGLDFSAWGLAALALSAVGAGGLVYAGVRARQRYPATLSLAIGCGGLLGALFVAALAGLNSDEPMRGAAGAVAALLAQCFTVLAWSGTHMALAGPLTPDEAITPRDTAQEIMHT